MAKIYTEKQPELKAVPNSPPSSLPRIRFPQPPDLEHPPNGAKDDRKRERNAEQFIEKANDAESRIQRLHPFLPFFVKMDRQYLWLERGTGINLERVGKKLTEKLSRKAPGRLKNLLKAFYLPSVIWRLRG